MGDVWLADREHIYRLQQSGTRPGKIHTRALCIQHCFLCTIWHRNLQGVR